MGGGGERKEECVERLKSGCRCESKASTRGFYTKTDIIDLKIGSENETVSVTDGYLNDYKRPVDHIIHKAKNAGSQFCLRLFPSRLVLSDYSCSYAINI